MTTADISEYKEFRQRYPNIDSIELLSPDINGILRGKRIPVSEAEDLYGSGINAVATMSLCNALGSVPEGLNIGLKDGDPDVVMTAVAGTLVPTPWLGDSIGQVLGQFLERDGSPGRFDPRWVLQGIVDKLAAIGVQPVVAAELEFYLLEDGDSDRPVQKIAKVPGTNLSQPGFQYAMTEDLADNQDFLDDISACCVAQNIPSTTIHSEFSPGQFELNLHHVDDPVMACDHAVLLKRIIKGTARKNGSVATFMAKPFPDIDGSGLHVHLSLYDSQGNNVFADSDSTEEPAISEKMRHAVGGLAETMASSMAIFAPNANSYRRLMPGVFAPLAPNWGYNHRLVSLRIPVSNQKNMRIEHRVSGADANPYLVMAAILTGVHYGLTHQCDPGEMIAEGHVMEEENVVLPHRWEAALDELDAGKYLPEYLGEEYFKLLAKHRRLECDEYHSNIPTLDYQWYLRSV
ncbi:MAG: glutamine synthetase family protein [Pseudomonadales bacterium]